MFLDLIIFLGMIVAQTCAVLAIAFAVILAVAKIINLIEDWREKREEEDDAK